MRITYLFLLVFLSGAVWAQDTWQFPEPAVASGQYTITDTVYMSPIGSDTNTGTFDFPVATFQKALQLLPFGTAGVNGGNAYGLVRLLPGTYVLPDGLQQYANQFQQGSTFKNVSIEGIGQVMVEGTKDTFINGHAIRLMGSHIYIKNLSVKYAQIHGILISGPIRPSNVLIDSVVVDSVNGFCMLLSDADTILVRNSRALRGSRPGADSLTSGCQWPSGIKFYGCTWATIHDSEVAYTRGEGLNFHNSEFGLAYNNVLHDNPTNIYCDNSARIIIRNNFNYATPGNTTYWRTCPANTNLIYGSTGILIANEGACGVGGPNYQNCTTVCAFESRSFPQADSIFIHNNFFVNTTPALSLWQGVTAVPGYNCVRNIFFHHNTVVGVTGDSTAGNAAMIYAFFPNFHNTVLNQGFAIGENINVYGNIISYDTKKYNRVQPILVVRDQNFPVPFDLKVDHNRIIETDNEMGLNGVVDTTMPVSIEANIDTVLKYFQPCMEHPSLVQQVPPTAWIAKDYAYTDRMNPTNVGALEYQLICETPDTVNTVRDFTLDCSLYPNPTKGNIVIERKAAGSDNLLITLTDISGKMLFRETWLAEEEYFSVHSNQLAPGLYFVTLKSQSGGFQSLKFIKQ